MNLIDAKADVPDHLAEQLEEAINTIDLYQKEFYIVSEVEGVRRFNPGSGDLRSKDSRSSKSMPLRYGGSSDWFYNRR